MLDAYLPDYFVTDTAINALISGRSYRNRAPQDAPFPFLVTCDQKDTDEGQVADIAENLKPTRVIGTFTVFVCHNDSFSAITQLKELVSDKMKGVGNQFIPQNTGKRIWVQCIIIKDVVEFNYVPVDGNERPMVGYMFTIKAGFDKPVS